MYGQCEVLAVIQNLEPLRTACTIVRGVRIAKLAAHKMSQKKGGTVTTMSRGICTASTCEGK
eukprot:139819-Amphidinium_carterae.1